MRPQRTQSSAQRGNTAEGEDKTMKDRHERLGQRQENSRREGSTAYSRVMASQSTGMKALDSIATLQRVSETPKSCFLQK